MRERTAGPAGGNHEVTIPQRAGLARDKITRGEVSNIRIPGIYTSTEDYLNACKTNSAIEEDYKVAR